MKLLSYHQAISLEDSMEPLFATYQLVALGLFVALFAARSIHLVGVRGIQVFNLVKGKAWPEAALEALFLVAFPVWLLEIVIHAWPLPFDLVPAAIDPVLFTTPWARGVGAALQLVGIVLFGGALASFGDSWRVGVDQRTPGSLVTDGLFGWSRNPIFLSMDLFLVGAFLLNGHLFALVFALATAVGFHRQILAEERFLQGHYGDPYRTYRNRVHRYLGRAH